MKTRHDNVEYLELVLKKALNGLTGMDPSDEDIWKFYCEHSVLHWMVLGINDFELELIRQIVMTDENFSDRITALPKLSMLKTCRACMQSQISSKGHFWYTRSQNIPGVHSCADHDEVLSVYQGSLVKAMQDPGFSPDNNGISSEADQAYALFVHEYLASDLWIDSYTASILIKNAGSNAINQAAPYIRYINENPKALDATKDIPLCSKLLFTLWLCYGSVKDIQQKLA